jgi:RNA polymerase primary sigma factor
MELSPQQLRMVRKAMRAYHSPTQYVGKEEQSTLGEVIVDNRQDTPAEEAVHHDDLSRMLHLLDEIDHRAAEIIKLRFGLDGSQPLTLKEIGQRIGLTRERVRQIEQETLGKLKDSLAENRA